MHTHLFCELSPLIKAHVAGWCANQLGDSVLLHVLRHIQTHLMMMKGGKWWQAAKMNATLCGVFGTASILQGFNAFSNLLHCGLALSA